MKYTSIILIYVLLASCQGKKQAGWQNNKALNLPVIELPTRTITGHTTYPVSIEGIINSKVRAKVSGYITDVLVDEGERVQKGQLLFRIETHSLTQDAKAAKANVNAAQVGVDQLKPLVAKNIISKVQLETAKAKLSQAQAAYNSIVANLDYANIESPIDGYVGAIPYRTGSLVSPTNELPLTTVSNTKSVYVYFAMNEADYLDFLQNTPGNSLSEKIDYFPKVSLQLSNGKTYNFKGKIERVTAQVNPATGTVSFRATFPNPNHLLANGSSGKIIIPKTYTDAILVPEIATYEAQGKVYLYQVVGDSLAVSRIIEVKDKIGNLIVVKSGIEGGAKIVAEGVGKLQNKTPIVPKLIPFDSIANSLNTVFK